ncbi:hypothetical protein ROZALSC1DRAFT_31784, partial [Rozella allomycis CSF55]
TSAIAKNEDKKTNEIQQIYRTRVVQIRGVVGNYDVPVTIDSGSEINVMSEELFQKLNIGLDKSCKLVMINANGAPTKIL